MRAEIAASWHRSAVAGVDTNQIASPLSLNLSNLQEKRSRSLISKVFPILDSILGEVARTSDAVMAVTDDAGQVLWVRGSRSARRRAEYIGLVEGSIWDESLAGTNAPGLVLHQGVPAAVAAFEHFRRSLHSWSCVAAPIHDPVTSQLIGVVDISGGDGLVNSQTMGLVRATARLAEAELKNSDDGRTSLEVGMADTPTLRLDVLGRVEGRLSIDVGYGEVTRMDLSPRHSEIMILLADASRGLFGDELSTLMYETDGGESTVRAEINRLRRVLGDDLVSSRPYRINAEIAGDWLAVEARLAAGDIAGAVRDFSGPALFRSTAPGVIQLRDRLTNRLRSAIKASRRVDLMAAWTRSAWGVDDYEMWAAQLHNLRRDSPLWALAQGQLRRLDEELGI
ncbi:transcriptional regulator [Rhodococcus ruber]|nr:transcriptional regulator [Rhodococcus ruber]